MGEVKTKGGCMEENGHISEISYGSGEDLSYCLVVLAPASRRILAAARHLCDRLKKHGLQILSDEESREIFDQIPEIRVRYLTEVGKQALDHISLVVSVGGDGTVLRAAALAVVADAPLAGVHAGKVGFLARIPEQVPEAVMDRLISGTYPEQRRMTLDACWKQGRVKAALNDITLTRIGGDRMCTFRVYRDGEKVAAWRADGVILFTPTGSTAYAYSCGSPALDPDIQAVGVIPVCPQSGRSNGLICSIGHPLTVAASGERVRIQADGKAVGYLESGETLSVTCGEKSIRFMQISPEWRIDQLNQRLNCLED